MAIELSSPLSSSLSPVLRTFTVALALSWPLACVSTTPEPTPESPEERAPLGKADAYGSCAGDEGEPSYCGGKSDGNCWCDEICSVFGDCCADVRDVCGDTSPPEPVECLASSQCEGDQYCHFESECGEGPIGICKPIAAGCNKHLAPVCGCDAVTYANDCFAAAAAVSVQSDGPCPGDETYETCEGACGGKSSGECWCDSRCTGLGDCCEDYAEVCEEVDVCETLLEEFAAETKTIRSCDSDDECGQVLTGTSCGCTRNWVARIDADIETWEAIRDAAQAEGCAIPGGISTCDCPPADGFHCEPEAGMCNWNYL